MVSEEDFGLEIKCLYKGEQYSVRDNGAVFRHSPDGKRPRPTDNKWTFGKLNTKTGYLEIATVRIHRIVATAFHGEPPTKEHVVDHIDTNKQNNRPDNLRWVTRLENVLLNPITARRIEIICGSVEAFLANPSEFRDRFPEPNYEWMCRVSAQEAEESRRRLLNWAQSSQPLQGGTIGEWIFNRAAPIVQVPVLPKRKDRQLPLTDIEKQIQEALKGEGIFKRDYPQPQFDEANQESVREFSASITTNVVQVNWKTPTDFVCCPKEIVINPIEQYSNNLKVGKLFSVNQYSKSVVANYQASPDKNTLWVMCQSQEGNSLKPWSLVQITFENDVFVHESLGTFFEKVGAEKQFTLAQGLEWHGGETFDELC